LIGIEYNTTVQDVTGAILYTKPLLCVKYPMPKPLSETMTWKPIYLLVLLIFFSGRDTTKKEQDDHYFKCYNTSYK